MNKKAITVIIPTYNSEKTLCDTLDSLRQQMGDFLVLFADGGSKDRTLSIINDYKRQLRIKVISTADHGQADALNKLIAHVDTDFFLWLNSDDILLPDAIGSFISVLKRNDCRNYAYISANNWLFDGKHIVGNAPGGRVSLKDIQSAIWFGPFPSVIWNTKLVRGVGGLDSSLHYAMDLDLAMRIGYKYSLNPINRHINRYLGCFRVHQASKTTSGKFVTEIEREYQYLKQKHNLSQFICAIRKVLIRLRNPAFLVNRYVKSCR